MRDWESPTAASSQAATHLPGSHQPPDTCQGSVSQSFLPFLRLWPHSRLGLVFQVPTCPQSCREAAPHRDTAGSQIHRETSVLLFPLHMHQAGESPPPRVLVLSRINTSAGTSSPTHQRGGVRSQCVSDEGRRQSLPQITAGTSSSTINTIQLMSKGVSSASPCEPVTRLVQPRHPGASYPATTQGQISSREPQGHGQTLNPRGHPVSAQAGAEQSLTVLTSGEVGIGREQSLAGWQRWL